MDFKAAYIISSVIGQIFCWSAAIITPVYFTPGNYAWTIVLLCVSVFSDLSLTRRIDNWERIDNNITENKLV